MHHKVLRVRVDDRQVQVRPTRQLISYGMPQCKLYICPPTAGMPSVNNIKVTTAGLEHDLLVLGLLLNVSREVFQKLGCLTLAYNLDNGRRYPSSRIYYNNNYIATAKYSATTGSAVSIITINLTE